MNRNTKLFIVFNVHWKVLLGIVPNEQKQSIAIYRLRNNPNINHYAFLSASDFMDRFISERMQGGFDDRDVILNNLKKEPEQYELLYGEKELASNLTYKLNNELDFINWCNFSIQKNEEKYILCIICSSEQQSETLFKLISSNKFKIFSSINQQTHQWTLGIKFEDLEPIISFVTNETLISYPQLRYLTDGTVNFISTGYQTRITGNGENSYTVSGLFPLKTINPLN